MDIILNSIKNTTIFNNFNYKKNIEKLIVANIDYNIIIDEFNNLNKKEIYIGELNDNNKSVGNGILLLNEFILIKGIFNGKEEIKNSEVYINNKLFCKGNLINGRLNSICTVYNNDIIVYNGNLENNIPNDSKCLYTFMNKNKYTGMITNGVIEGHGTMVYLNNTKYIGEWLNNKKHGNGKLYEGETVIIEGKWLNDKKNGIMKIINKSLVKYIEYNNDIIIKEYSKEEYIIMELNKEILVIKEDCNKEIEKMKKDNNCEIINIKQICEKQIKNLEKDCDKKIRESYENRLCKICFVNTADIVFDTCNHLVICKNCDNNMRRSSRYTKCPVCRTTYFTGKQIVFS